MLLKMTALLGGTLALIAPLEAGAGSAGAPDSAALSATSYAARHVTRRFARHPHDSGTCTGAGSNSFVSGFNNVAYGPESAVLAGSTNAVCDGYSAVAAGTGNLISSGGSGTAIYSFVGGGSDSRIFGENDIIGSGSENLVYGEYNGVIAGTLNTVTGLSGFVGSGSGNAVSYYDGFIGAGTNNSVSGQSAADVAGDSNTNSGTDGFIGAGTHDTITASTSAVIGGGNANSIVAQNFEGATSAGGSYSFIGGGGSNSILGAAQGLALYSSIAGGFGNAMTGLYGTIAGGYEGNVSGTAATVGGGEHNVASNTGAFVGGGSSSSATGQYSTIPGGYLNAANGTGSFAAGTLAKARTNGAFVWSDNSSNAPLQSTAPYQFMARAAGGFYLYSNAAATSGVKLAPGSGVWSSLSDRNMKNDIVPLDDATVLAKVASLPVSEWSYDSERGVRHVGPMAQDFYAAFRVGEDDRHITSIDEDGVALAAIKALHAENASLHAVTASLRHENAALRSGMAVIGAREAALEREVARLAATSRTPQRAK